MKNWVCYIFQKCSGIILNARTSVWVNQKGYTTLSLINLWMSKKLSMVYIPEVLRHYKECQDFSLGEPKRTFPYINHDWKTKYVIYPRSTQALHWMPGLQPGLTRKDTQHFPILTMTKKLSMLYIPETLTHYTECHDFCLGELERIHNISLY